MLLYEPGSWFSVGLAGSAKSNLSKKLDATK
jgi:hypothetical protein